ncbi:MAG: hypothetical protein HY093_00185, partial [Candidatus Liptonbacteria bacterium]|nr:hypothetical protein [Candidatus Liptonbacteria bacterium]
KPQVSSENIQITSFGQQIKVTGSLTNQNSFPLAGVKVMAIFFNSFEKPIGASLTEIDNIAPGESQPFSISHPSLSELKSEATKIFVFAQK